MIFECTKKAPFFKHTHTLTDIEIVDHTHVVEAQNVARTRMLTLHSQSAKTLNDSNLETKRKLALVQNTLSGAELGGGEQTLVDHLLIATIVGSGVWYRKLSALLQL